MKLKNVFKKTAKKAEKSNFKPMEKKQLDKVLGGGSPVVIHKEWDAASPLV
jgi:hypothetical protein